MAPLPPPDVTTGMFVASASRTRACSAPDCATPPPANISGDRERAMTAAASSSCSRLGTMRDTGAGFRSWTSSRSTSASGGMSITTGRGRPVRICLNASDTARGISRGEHLPPPLGHRAQHVRLVRDFVIGPKVLADLGAGYLAGNEEHGARSGRTRSPDRRQRCTRPCPGPPALPPAFPTHGHSRRPCAPRPAHGGS